MRFGRLVPPISRCLSAVGLLFLVVGFARTAQADITPPLPGVEPPESYKEFIRENPTAFSMSRGWRGPVERARLAREALDHPVEGGLASGLLETATWQARQVHGTMAIPVLAAKYSNTGADPYTPAQLQQRLFTGPNPTGTVTDYYREISHGQLTLTGQVIGTAAGGLFTVSQSDFYYEGGCNGICGNARTGEFLREVLDLADPRVNFGLYDNDGPDGVPNSGDDDGFVDAASFVHPEAGGECGGGAIWSHHWTYSGWWGSPYTTHDAAAGGGFIKVNDYSFEPLRSCFGPAMIEIGVYAHEFGHSFALPDLYDTDGSSSGIGTWCLMASGSWGGDNQHPDVPSHMSAWCKEMLGWVQPRVICSDLFGVELPAAADSAVALKVYPHGMSDTEYFLIENRVARGFDSHLFTSGLAVWHVDNEEGNNADDVHRLVDLEEADGWDHLDSKVNRGDSGDLFPGSSNRTQFTDATHPNTRDYALVPTGFSLTNIGAVADPRTFDIGVTECLIRVEGLLVNDAACGNNNGAVERGEIVEVRVGILNESGTPVNGVVGTISSLGAEATVLRGVASYGSVPSDQVTYAPESFVVQVNPSASDGSALPFLISLTWNGGEHTQASFSLTVGRYVLLVEDDGGVNNSRFYLDALAAIGRSVVRHDVNTQGVPTLAMLQAAGVVIWYTGQQTEGTFTAAEQSVVTSYLNGGGSLFVTGQDIGLDLVQTGSASDRTFYNSYLHADFVADMANDASLVGIAGDPIGNGLTLLISGGDGASNSMFSSRIAPRAGANTVFEYSAGIVGGVRYAGAHRVVYFAFNTEAVNAAGTRQTVLRRVLDWLAPQSSGAPTVTLLGPDGGETLDACAPREITWSASDPDGIAQVDLYYGRTGEPLYPHLIAAGLPNTGSYSWTTPGLSGTDFRIKVLARDPGGLQGVALGNAFTVDANGPSCGPGIQVVSPNGGEVVGTGNPVAINWTEDSSLIGQMTYLSYSLNGGTTWMPITSGTSLESPYVWFVPNVASANCRVRVEVQTSGSLDVSDAAFAIVDDDVPVLGNLRPNGGEIVQGGSVLNVHVYAFDNIAVTNLCVSYTLNDGASWASATCGSFALPFPWSTPGVETNQCRLRVEAWDAAGNHAVIESQSTFALIGQVTGIPEGLDVTRPGLVGGHPNPMSARGTMVGYYLPEDMEASLRVFDLAGRRVTSLAEGRLSAGYHEVSWGGTDEGGAPTASGVFFLVLETPHGREVQRIVKLR